MSALQDAISKAKKDFGLEIGSADEILPTMEVKGLSTGNIALDAITGVGGYPVGRIIEQYGEYSSGKTTSVLQAMALVQQSGGNVAFFDYEKTLDPVYCAKLGLDVEADTFIYSQPDTFEQGANAFRLMMETGELTLAAFDSVASMVTEHELTADTGKVTVADRAKMMHQFMRQIVGGVSKYNTTVVFLNHVMDKVDTTFMGQQLAARGMTKKTTPGGTALEYYSSMRIEFKKAGNVKTEQNSVVTNEITKTVNQAKVIASVVKNKVGNAHGTVELRIRYGKGFSNEYSAFHILEAHKVIKKKPAGYFDFPAELAPDDITQPWKGHGEENIIAALESNPEWFSRVAYAAYEVIDKYGVEQVEPAPDTTLEGE